MPLPGMLSSGAGLMTPPRPIGPQTYLGFCGAQVSGALQITKWLIRKADVMGGGPKHKA